MALVDRIIIAVVAVVLTIIGVFAALTTWGSSVLIDWLVSLKYAKLDGILLIIILLLLAAYLIMMIFSSFKSERRSIVRSTELGDIRINAQTIIGLVDKAVKEIEGIKDVDVRLHEVEPLKVEIGLQLLPDYHIPHLTESIQLEIKNYLQNTVGVETDVINILVKGVLPEQRIRVQ
ncbi:MAG: alkaline shock response membrane anchor protein AmaP [Firmicutes bacterium]|nr:alkaline shock response membrane anchor protein AmaP [Bacillota bacterium]